MAAHAYLNDYSRLCDKQNEVVQIIIVDYSLYFLINLLCGEYWFRQFGYKNSVT